jgi:hypothetical protein
MGVSCSFLLDGSRVFIKEKEGRLVGWLVAWFIMPPGMFSDDFSWPLLTLGKSRIHF